jgi:CO/xanthine dehydrogenase Mo-binding subunit
MENKQAACAVSARSTTLLGDRCVGEMTISAVAASVLNAIAAATGKPVRSLPRKNCEAREHIVRRR